MYLCVYLASPRILQTQRSDTEWFSFFIDYLYHKRVPESESAIVSIASSGIWWYTFSEFAEDIDIAQDTVETRKIFAR